MALSLGLGVAPSARRPLAGTAFPWSPDFPPARTCARTKRSRQLATGGKEPKVAWENDKPTVVALREIAAGLVDYDVIAQDDIVEEEPLFAAFEEEANEPL